MKMDGFNSPVTPAKIVGDNWCFSIPIYQRLFVWESEQIDRLLDEKDLEREGRVAAEQGYCRHFGCVLREPAIGQGREWLESHKADPAMGADYLPINQLLMKYGQEKKTKES